MTLYYERQRRCLTDDRTAIVLTELERLVVEQLASGSDVVSADAICTAVWSNHGPDAHNGLRTTLAYLRSKCARAGLEEPARHLGKSGLVRSNIVTRAHTPERCPHCGQPMPDHRPTPRYVRRGPRGAR